MVEARDTGDIVEQAPSGQEASVDGIPDDERNEDEGVDYTTQVFKGGEFVDLLGFDTDEYPLGEGEADDEFEDQP